MLLTVAISSLTILSIILSVVFKPSFKIKNHSINLYWIISFIGMLLILFTGRITFNEWTDALTASGSINPIKILILFLSMTIISIYLDELGFFNFIASFILSRTKGSQKAIFISFYIMIAVLTMFTSNDIIIFTLTPFIIFFSKRAKISPVPYLVMEFTTANTWSMIFLIGNPTNIYLTQTYGIGFMEYFKVMAVPTALSGLIEFAVLYLLFRKKLNEPVDHNTEIDKLKNIPETVIGLIVLFICTVFFILSSYISIPMWIISLISMLSLMIISFIYSLIKRKKPLEALHSLKRASYELIPFVIGMFTIVLALDKYRITEWMNNMLGESFVIYKYGITSFLSSNLLNNIPMTIMFSKIVEPLSGLNLYKAVYSTIIGSNIGAFLTPIGALAGIMWISILKNHEIKFSFLDFIKYGIIISVPTIITALLMLEIIL